MEARAVPAPALNAEERNFYEKGVGEFNARLFFECHDTLEELWAGVRGPSRDFFQGLIQVAVGFHHIGNGNRVGAERLFGRALKRLEGYPDDYAGLALGELRDAVTGWRRALDPRAPADLSGRTPPHLSLAPAWAATPPATVARGRS
jgi:predicted metal-dependent hydrolase